MTVKILYGFDTEYPYGPKGATAEGARERESDLELIGRLNEVMEKAKAGRTFFILGDYLAQSQAHLGAEHLRQVLNVQSDLVEIGQHTYSHITIAPIKTRPDKAPAPIQTLREELTKANQIIKKTLGREARGLRTPLGYPHLALVDQEAVLEAIKNEGLTYVSSSLRNKDFGINAPLLESGEPRQPFLYSNGIVEVPSHGWQDTALTGNSKTIGTQDYPKTKEEIVGHYASIISEAEEKSRELDKTIYVGLCLHPQAINSYDPSLEVIKRLLEIAEEKGFESASYGMAANEVKKA